MAQRVLRLLLLLVALVGPAACETEPRGAGLNISGIVVATDSTPVAGATVQIIQMEWKTSTVRSTTYSNSAGRFNLRAYDSECSSNKSTLTLFVTKEGKLSYYSGFDGEALRCSDDPQEVRVVMKSATTTNQPALH